MVTARGKKIQSQKCDAGAIAPTSKQALAGAGELAGTCLGHSLAQGQALRHIGW